jgi:prepilin-type N-terminal cleavage/methylation domain-containing protein
MKQHRRTHAGHSQGFTLVEMIMVVVMLGIAGVGISSMQGSLFTGAASVKDMQVRTPLMLECAEQVLAVRRFTEDGYAAVNSTAFGTNLCGSGFTTLDGYAIPSVTITDVDTTTNAACPNSSCKLVVISQNGMTPLTLLLVDY